MCRVTTRSHYGDDDVSTGSICTLFVRKKNPVLVLRIITGCLDGVDGLNTKSSKWIFIEKNHSCSSSFGFQVAIKNCLSCACPSKSYFSGYSDYVCWWVKILDCSYENPIFLQKKWGWAREFWLHLQQLTIVLSLKFSSLFCTHFFSIDSSFIIDSHFTFTVEHLHSLSIDSRSKKNPLYH